MISAIQNNKSVYFGNSRCITTISKADGVEKLFNHQTEFFRDLPILNYIVDYTQKHFPEGAHIADFGASQGQETHSLAMLFSEANKDKRYKITGYDIIPSVIETAKKGVFVIDDNDRSESLLFKNRSLYVPITLMRNGQFISWACAAPDSVNKKVLDKLGVTEQDASRVKKLFNEHFSELQMTYTDEREFLKKHFPDDRAKHIDFRIVQADKSKFDGVIDFQVGDIRNASGVLADKRPSVVLAHNLIYHLTGAKNDDYLIAKMPPAREAFDEIHRSLRDKGIFSIGNLSFDHLQSESEYGTEILEQEGKKIRVCQNSPVHKEMRNAGFEPIFYAKGSMYPSYVPVVWKKS